MKKEAMINELTLLAGKENVLDSAMLTAAGLDVYKNEPNIHPVYRQLPNVFLMPHIGNATKETRGTMGLRALDNLDAMFAGREPRDRVT